MYPRGVCRIRKPAYAGNGCAIFPAFDTEEWAEKIRSQSQTIYSELPKGGDGIPVTALSLGTPRRPVLRGKKHG